MTLDARQTAIVAWVAALTGVSATYVGFKNDARANIVTQGVFVDLSWVSDTGAENDEIRYERDDAAVAPDPNMTPIQVGDRKLSLQVAVETSRQTATVNARSILERMRGRMRLPGSLATLRAANLGLAGIGAIVPADYNADGRMVSRVLCEVHLNASSFERGETTDQVGSIESVEVSSEYITVGEDPIPTPEQVTNMVIP